MSETITAISTVEDITELTWEDLALEMAEGAGEDYEHTVSTADGCGCGGVSTCVTTYTSTTTASNPT